MTIHSFETKSTFNKIKCIYKIIKYYYSYVYCSCIRRWSGEEDINLSGYKNYRQLRMAFSVLAWIYKRYEITQLERYRDESSNKSSSNQTMSYADSSNINARDPLKR